MWCKCVRLWCKINPIWLQENKKFDMLSNLEYIMRRKKLINYTNGKILRRSIKHLLIKILNCHSDLFVLTDDEESRFLCYCKVVRNGIVIETNLKNNGL